MINAATLNEAAADARERVEADQRVVVDLSWAVAWALLEMLQLALRHPGTTGFAADETRALVEHLKLRIATTPALKALADAGDDPIFDKVFAAAAADPRKH